uniref:Replication factor A C-terminal domain-containing protein n=1 Tax=Lactuca sativa TaxID=4236 RepID=A0A9R1X110_LACSA|nr:hypothetical protein LSAT_V11C700376350 [Lactuca sativa]
MKQTIDDYFIFIPINTIKYQLMVVVFFTVVFIKLSETNSLPHFCIFMAAAAADLTFITDLDVLKDNFTMKLCVIRLWTLECYYNKDEIFSIQVILMEEHGNKIQGYVPNAYVYKFRKVLKEGEAFFIKNPNLAKIDEDVIGLVVAIGEINARNEDRKMHKMRLQIQDANGSQLDVNLWGDYCYKFSDYIQKNANILRIVIILQFAKINVWQDRRYVNTYYDVSKFIINSDIDEIKVFKKSLNEDGPHENSPCTFSYMKSNRISEKDGFLLNHEPKTISDIFEPIEVKKILQFLSIFLISVFLDIVYVVNTLVPNNPSDEPNVTGSLKNVTYECRNPKCTKTETSTFPRFMISVRVQDHTGSITLTMFEQDANKFLKISAKDLVAKTAKLGFCTNVYPSDIKALKDMKLAFIVSVSKYNVQRNSNQYTISNISDDETLIEELEKKFVVAEGGNSQSFEHGTTDCESQDNIFIKDVISHTDDNVTPMNVFKSTATSPNKNLDATKDLKRAL